MAHATHSSFQVDKLLRMAAYGASLVVALVIVVFVDPFDPQYLPGSSAIYNENGVLGGLFLSSAFLVAHGTGGVVQLLVQRRSIKQFFRSFNTKLAGFYLGNTGYYLYHFLHLPASV